jgi:hypothetical protein
MDAGMVMQTGVNKTTYLPLLPCWDALARVESWVDRKPKNQYCLTQMVI